MFFVLYFTLSHHSCCCPRLCCLYFRKYSTEYLPRKWFYFLNFGCSFRFPFHNIFICFYHEFIWIEEKLEKIKNLFKYAMHLGLVEFGHAKQPYTVSNGHWSFSHALFSVIFFSSTKQYSSLGGLDYSHEYLMWK